MSNTPRLSKSGIEYLDYQWGIWSGCRNWENGVCPVGERCWARSIARRFLSHYPNGFEPTFYPEALESPLHLKKPSIIGVGWMGDIIGYCNGPAARIAIFDTIKRCPQHTFVFLTKNPERLPEWSPFPDNCWVGVTATDHLVFAHAHILLKDIEASLKYISIEPLLNWDSRITDAFVRQARQSGVNWLPIGAQTQPYRPPKIEWVREIVEACDKAGIPVFLKENLSPLILGNDKTYYDALFVADALAHLRQEMPEKS